MCATQPPFNERGLVVLHTEFFLTLGQVGREGGPKISDEKRAERYFPALSDERRGVAGSAAAVFFRMMMIYAATYDCC